MVGSNYHQTVSQASLLQEQTHYHQRLRSLLRDRISIKANELQVLILQYPGTNSETRDAVKIVVGNAEAFEDAIVLQRVPCAFSKQEVSNRFRMPLLTHLMNLTKCNTRRATQ